MKIESLAERDFQGRADTEDSTKIITFNRHCFSGPAISAGPTSCNSTSVSASNL